MVIENLPHRVIQTSKSIKYKDLDQDIKQTISDFELEYSEYLSTSPDINTDPAYAVLLQKSDNIGEYIYLNYVEHNDEVEYDIEELEDDNEKLDDVIKNIASSSAINVGNYEPQSNDEKVLHKMWLADKRYNITKTQLGEEGFDIGFFTPLGKYSCTIGRYRLERTTTSEWYRLKINK